MNVHKSRMRSWPKLLATERSLINEIIFSAFKFLEKSLFGVKKLKLKVIWRKAKNVTSRHLSGWLFPSFLLKPKLYSPKLDVKNQKGQYFHFLVFSSSSQKWNFRNKQTCQKFQNFRFISRWNRFCAYSYLILPQAANIRLIFSFFPFHRCMVSAHET